MSSNVDQAVGEAIQRFRTIRGWSQTEFADRLKTKGLAIAQQTIAKIEAGSRPLKLSESSIVADVLDIGVDDLLEMSSSRGVTRLVLDHQAERLRTARSALDEAVRNFENALVSAALTVVRGRDVRPDVLQHVIALQFLVKDWYDYDGTADQAKMDAFEQIADSYERVQVNEMFGGDGDPTA